VGRIRKDRMGQEDRVGESIDKLTIYLMGGISGREGKEEGKDIPGQA